MECPNCGSKDIELIESSGHAVCIQCGTVLEENTIVSSVEFQESGDRSHVVGQFVSATSSKAYGSASRGNSRYGFSRESREATLANARRNIAQVASSLRLPSYFIDRAQRLYSLALQRNFVYGRRQMHIVATVLYTICRQEKSPHLLIDFSDVLQVNVYTLGKSFLQLTKLLNLNLMVVDPSLYIHRFATRLELGDKVGPVSTTALRIVSRMKKDWINTGSYSHPPSRLCLILEQGDDQMESVRLRCS
jgi:transcription factor IIIB 90 kDa subunit